MGSTHSGSTKLSQVTQPHESVPAQLFEHIFDGVPSHPTLGDLGHQGFPLK